MMLCFLPGKDGRDASRTSRDTGRSGRLGRSELAEAEGWEEAKRSQEELSIATERAEADENQTLAFQRAKDLEKSNLDDMKGFMGHLESQVSVLEKK